MTKTPDAKRTVFRQRSGVLLSAAELLELGLSQGLSEITRASVDSIFAVYGQPGAGKTTALKARALAILQKQPAEALMVLAANRDAATDLRDELAIAYQGVTPGPLARTASSLAFGVLRHRALRLGQKPPELLTGAEQDRMLAELIAEAVADGSIDAFDGSVKAAVFELNGFRIELRDLITVCQEHSVDPEQLRALARKFEVSLEGGAKAARGQWLGAAAIYEKYLARLASGENAHRFDPTQVLVEATDYLLEAANEWPESLLALRSILVDDAQELTPAASRLIEAVCSRGAGLVLFGDPDASTLGFRAADPRAMAELIERVAQGSDRLRERIYLRPEHAVRTGHIGAVMQRISGQLESARAGLQRRGLAPSLDAEELEDGSIEAHVFNDATSEVSWLANRLRRLHLIDELPWQEMAVVARSNQQLDALASRLAAESVPVRVAGAQVALRDEFASRALLRAVHFALSDLNELAIGDVLELLNSPLAGFDPISIRRLRRQLRKQELEAEGKRNSDELLISMFQAEGGAVTVDSREGRQASKFIRNLHQVRELAETDSVETLLWQFWESSGLAKRWQADSWQASEIGLQANRNLDAVVALFAAANRYVERNPAGSAREFVDQQLALGLPEDTLAAKDSNRPTVTLLTPAGMIGRRFKVVALPGLIEGVWPNLRPRSSLLGATAMDALMRGRVESPDELQRSELPDEMRMLYKAVGGATERLLISAPQVEDAQVSQFLSLMLGTVPAAESFDEPQLTLRGLAGSLRRQLAEATDFAESESAALALARLAVAGVAGAEPSQWYGNRSLSSDSDLVNLELDQVRVYPSSLEKFIKCPLHWFLDSHGGSESSFSANLGTLVHKALEIATEATEQAYWDVVESKWHTLSFDAEWMQQAGRRRAQKMILNMVNYVRKFESEGGTVLGREVKVEFDLGRAHVSGTVDRVELTPEGKVVIVDLKTGKRAPAVKEMPTHAQLGLYQLGFLENAFSSLLAESGATGAELESAKLVIVSGDSATQRVQAALADDAEAKAALEAMVESAVEGMSGHIFAAQVSSHCTDENEFGSCSLHLIKAVSYVG